MRDLSFGERLREISRLIGENASREDVLAEATRLKNDIRVAMLTVGPVISALDELIAVFAPSADWRRGLWPETSTSRPASSAPVVAGPPPYNRRTRTLEIANEMHEKGSQKVRTDHIAARLRSEGDTSSIKNLEVAIGNLLTRSERWKWIGPREYAPNEQN